MKPYYQDDYGEIYNENCLDTMKRMPDNHIDLTVTSPPYNIGKSRMIGGLNKKLKYDEYDDDLAISEYFDKTKEWIDEILRVTKHHVFWNVQELTGNKGIISFIMNEYKNVLKETFVWAKTNPPSCIVDTMCASGFEYIFCFSKDNPESRKFNYCNFSNKNGDYIKNILIKSVNSGKENSNHSFSFGEWLPSYFIKNFSHKGDLIYDPFCGSGTTTKMAKEHYRRYIGSEISEEYCEIIKQRMSQEVLPF